MIPVLGEQQQEEIFYRILTLRCRIERLPLEILSIPIASSRLTRAVKAASFHSII